MMTRTVAFLVMAVASPHRHLKRPVAVDTDDGFVRKGEFRTDGRGEPIAHGAETARREEIPRRVARIPLHRPHLMLTHAGRDDRVALRQAVQLLDDVLRPQNRVGSLIGKRVFVFPP